MQIVTDSSGQSGVGNLIQTAYNDINQGNPAGAFQIASQIGDPGVTANMQDYIAGRAGLNASAGTDTSGLGGLLGYGSSRYGGGRTAYAPFDVGGGKSKWDEFVQTMALENAKLQQAQNLENNRLAQEKLLKEEELGQTKQLTEEKYAQEQRIADQNTVEAFDKELMSLKGPADPYGYLFASRGLAAPRGYSPTAMPLAPAVEKQYQNQGIDLATAQKSISGSSGPSFIQGYLGSMPSALQQGPMGFQNSAAFKDVAPGSTSPLGGNGAPSSTSLFPASSGPTSPTSPATPSPNDQQQKPPPMSGPTPGPGGLPSFAVGGTVPGPTGQPQLAVVHGGETVTPVDIGTIRNRNSDAQDANVVAWDQLYGGGIPIDYGPATGPTGWDTQSFLPYGSQIQLGTPVTGAPNMPGPRGSTSYYPVNYNGRTGFVSAFDVANQQQYSMDTSTPPPPPATPLYQQTLQDLGKGLWQRGGETGTARAANPNGITTVFDAQNPGIPIRSNSSLGDIIGYAPWGQGGIDITGPMVTGANNFSPNNISGSTDWDPVSYKGIQGFVSGYDLNPSGYQMPATGDQRSLNPQLPTGYQMTTPGVANQVPIGSASAASAPVGSANFSGTPATAPAPGGAPMGSQSTAMPPIGGANPASPLLTGGNLMPAGPAGGAPMNLNNLDPYTRSLVDQYGRPQVPSAQALSNMPQSGQDAYKNYVETVAGGNYQDLLDQSKQLNPSGANPDQFNFQ